MKFLPVLFAILACTAGAQTIVCPPDAPQNVRLAAKEVRRYVYLRTGAMPAIVADPTAPAASSDPKITLAVDPSLGKEEYRLKSDGKVLGISGGTDTAVLYGAYAFIEKLGVRFYLHGDVIPDGKIPLALPKLDESHKPLFDTRGIQPFHDFPEGPDWWTTGDYRAHIAQLAKLKMNFIGFHNYPGELLLWHGLEEDINPDGTVKSTYDSQWFTSVRGGWGYGPLKTSGFTAGAAQLFPVDVVASEVTGGDNKHFDRVAKMLGTIVRDAHTLGIKVAVGTESPLRIPGSVQARLKALGKQNHVQEVYKGTFAWLKKNAPVDYYWAWTPEGWIWNGNTAAAYKAVENDIMSAQAAARELGNPFPVGTCGWVLGPQQNRAAWDEMLAKDAPIANINPQAGHAAIDASFSTIKGRPTWAIPWLENDPDMVGYQPWVKRMRHDAADARRRGCTGLLGIHWRTKILAQNISALAQAGWDQSWLREEMLAGAAKTDGAGSGLNRGMPADDFYRDFARAHFGGTIADRAGEILTAADGFTTAYAPKYPEFTGTSEWIGGPGAMRTIREPWGKVRDSHYAFVEKFAALRPQVLGMGNRARFDYWMNTLRASALMVELACHRGALDIAIGKMKTEKSPAAKKSLAGSALVLRGDLARGWEKLIRLQIQLVSSPGELGTIANLEQHSRVNNKWLTVHDPALAEALGAPLPADCTPSMDYAGPTVLTVPTVRTSIDMGEALTLPILALDKPPVKSVSVRVRAMGTGDWQTIGARHVARAVWNATLPAATDDFEYQVIATGADGAMLHWPATAPERNQTVIVTN